MRPGQRGGDLRVAFEEFEWNEHKAIEEEPFRRGLQKLGCDLSRHDVRLLMDKLDDNGDGQISYVAA